MIGGFGMIPGTIVYIYIGTTLGNISDIASGGGKNLATQLLLIIGSVLALIAVIYISIVARRMVNEILQKQKEQELKVEL